MKRMALYFILAALLTALLMGGGSAFAFTSGSTGADGAFAPTTTGTIEVQVPESGILNYTTVNIPFGVTVKFKKNSANTPVYILATGNVTISNGGWLVVDGTSAINMTPGKGGPGGFDGGIGGSYNTPGGKGIGPGGGSPAGLMTVTNYVSGNGGGGGFGSAGLIGAGTTSNPGGAGGTSYGNSVLQPMIGGSGGGGGAGYNASSTKTPGGGGGGGGGAIVIASSGIVDISGHLTAKGGTYGSGGTNAGSGGAGSGGAIKIVATEITGTGEISAAGGGGTSSVNGKGADGIIRLEADTNRYREATTPGFTSGPPTSVFLPNASSLNITSIGGTAVPTTPTGSYATPDIVLPASVIGPVSVGITAANIPTGTTVTVTVTPLTGASSNTTALLSGTTESSTATASVTISNTSVSVLSATATFTLQAGLDSTPVYADGERVIKMRVASVLGGRSEITYITESGREVPAGI